jgi:ABC-type multidrug transport system fused ATPase/permease subunit
MDFHTEVKGLTKTEDMLITGIFKQYKFKLSLTLALLLLESLLLILYPLFIGFAVNGLINGTKTALLPLGILAFGNLIIGALRRFYDSRVYASIFKDYAHKLQFQKEEKNVSNLSARLNLLGELVSFMEESLPSIANHVISLVGTLIIVYFLSLKIFLACLIVFVLSFVIYRLSKQKTLLYNRRYNNELEEQVKTITQYERNVSRKHFKNLMRWNIKLSDLETINFSGIWFLMSALLIFSILIITGNLEVSYGIALSSIMYVFQFMDDTMNLPLHYQQSLRLIDISERLNKSLTN